MPVKFKIQPPEERPTFCTPAYKSMMDQVASEFSGLKSEFPTMSLPTSNCQRSGCGAIDRAMLVAVAAGLPSVDVLLTRIDEAAIDA